MNKLILFFSFVCVIGLKGQSEENYHELKTFDGKYRYGKLLKADSSIIEFLTKDNEKLVYPHNEVLLLMLSNKRKLIKEKRQSIYSSNGMYAETAIPMKKGNIYFSSTFILENRFKYALNDYFTIDVGNSPYLPSIAGNDIPLFPYVGFKANKSFLHNQLHVGAKFSISSKSWEGSYIDEIFGREKFYPKILNGYITLGDNDANISFSYNRLIDFDQYTYNPINEILQFSGTIRLSKRNYLNVESIRLSMSSSLSFIGIRHDRYSISYTYGLMYFADKVYADLSIPLPYFSLKVPIISD